MALERSTINIEKDRLGKGSFEKVMAGISLLRKSKLQWGALVVLTKTSLGLEERIFKFLVRNGIYNFDLLPIISLDKKWMPQNNYSISPEEFCEIIVKIFTLWWRR